MLYQKGFSYQRGVSQYSKITVQDWVHPGAAYSPCSGKKSPKSRETQGKVLTYKQIYPLFAQINTKPKRPQHLGLQALPSGDFLTV